jgi:hypothetical protein
MNDFLRCSSPFRAKYPEGQVNVQIRAVLDGVVGTPAVRNFILDRVAPFFMSNPSCTGSLADGTADCSFRINEPSATALCRLDNDPTEICDSSSFHTFFDVGGGTHTATVTPRDISGRLGRSRTTRFTMQ